MAIIWLTGQPKSGKTTLALHVEALLGSRCKAVIDGDDIRKGSTNVDYSKEGRLNNIKLAQQLAVEYEESTTDPGKFVIVSVVAPYRKMREEFKSKHNVYEIYLFSDRVDNNNVSDYEPPLSNALFLNTSRYGIELCAKRIINFCGVPEQEQP